MEMNLPPEKQYSSVLPFTLENLPVRGKFLRLHGLKAGIPSLKNAQEEAQSSLQSMLIGMALLLTEFKTSSAITLQIQDNETQAVLAVHGTHTGAVKAYASKAAQTQPFADYTKHGALFALSAEQNGETYQSFIPLEGETLTETLVNYFTQSVQAATKLYTWDAADAGGDTVAALFLQATPEEGSGGDFETQHKDDWQRFSILLDTVENHEALDVTLPPEELVYRLFHEDGVRAYEKLTLNFTPANPREKMLQALVHIGEKECRDMLQDGPIVMRDDYTGLEETFSEANINLIFSAEDSAE